MRNGNQQEIIQVDLPTSSRSVTAWLCVPAVTNWVRRLARRRVPSSCVETSTAISAQWQRIATIGIEGCAGRSPLRFSPQANFRLIKLRCRVGNVAVYRWTLQFEDGAFQDVFMHCLFEGAESQPILISGRRLQGMVLEYDAPSPKLRGVLEVWAQPDATSTRIL